MYMSTYYQKSTSRSIRNYFQTLVYLYQVIFDENVGKLVFIDIRLFMTAIVLSRTIRCSFGNQIQDSLAVRVTNN